MNTQTMISTGGRVVVVPFNDIELKKAQGWKVVINPQRTYYAEYDANSGGITAPDNMTEDLQSEDLLVCYEV